MRVEVPRNAESGHGDRWCGTSLQQIGQLFDSGTLAGLTDVQLLQRFLTRKDEAAFEALVRKHGPMVLAVCRRRLSDPNDVDDAFQATFLVLIRRASDIRDQARLASWLYGVAHKVAERARLNAIKRRVREGKVTPMTAGTQPTNALDDLDSPPSRRHPRPSRPLPVAHRPLLPPGSNPRRGRSRPRLADRHGQGPPGTRQGSSPQKTGPPGLLRPCRPALRLHRPRRGSARCHPPCSVPPSRPRSSPRPAKPSPPRPSPSTAAALAQEVAQTMIRHYVTLLVLGVAALGLIGTECRAPTHGKAGIRDRNPNRRHAFRSDATTPIRKAPERQVEATVRLLDAKSRLAQVRTESLLKSYQSAPCLPISVPGSEHGGDASGECSPSGNRRRRDQTGRRKSA